MKRRYQQQNGGGFRRRNGGRNVLKRKENNVKKSNRVSKHFVRLKRKQFSSRKLRKFSELVPRNKHTVFTLNFFRILPPPLFLFQSGSFVNMFLIHIFFSQSVYGFTCILVKVEILSKIRVGQVSYDQVIDEILF